MGVKVGENDKEELQKIAKEIIKKNKIVFDRLADT